jgi:hypothetical protein
MRATHARGATMSNGWKLLRGGVVLAVFLFSASGLAGCASTSGFSDDPLKPDDRSIAAMRDQYWSQAIVDCYHAGRCSNPQLGDRKAIRDYIVLGRVHVYRVEFSLLVRTLSSGNNLVSVGSDLTALILNGLGATTGDAATKAALAAASAGVLAANGAIDKDLFYSKTVPAIITQMEANRARAEATIFEGLKLPDNNYDLGRATHDLDLLNDAGSLSDAISSITQKATDEKKDAQAEDWTTPYRSGEMTTSDTSTKLKAWIKTAGNFALLSQWWDANASAQQKQLPFPEALLDDGHDDIEALRAKAVTDLKVK